MQTTQQQRRIVATCSKTLPYINACARGKDAGTLGWKGAGSGGESQGVPFSSGLNIIITFMRTAN